MQPGTLCWVQGHLHSSGGLWAGPGSSYVTQEAHWPHQSPGATLGLSAYGQCQTQQWLQERLGARWAQWQQPLNPGFCTLPADGAALELHWA